MSSKFVAFAGAGTGTGAGAAWVAWKYEVCGRVQGVFFRAHTAAKAEAVGILGYVRNAPDGKRVVRAGIVQVGEAEGPAPAMTEFRRWLSTEGSPKSVIEKATFTEERTSAGPSGKYSAFTILRGPAARGVVDG